jgi:hypothetical protein
VDAITGQASGGNRGAVVTARGLGAWLGVLNVFFCAIAIGISEPDTPHCCDHSHAIEIAMIVLFACIIPGMLVGRWLGALAEDMRDEPPWHRLFVMFGICVAFVGLLGGWGELEVMIVPVLIPSAVGCLILERRTRAPDALPTAAIS